MPRSASEPTTRVANVPEELTGQPRRVVAGGISLRATFAALRHRNFRLFFFGQLVSLVGTWMQNTALGWLVYQLTGSKLLLGAVAAVSSLPMLLLSTWGGSLADRHPKRRLLLWTQTAMMVFAFALAALVWSGRIAPWHILVLAACGGVAMAFDMPIRQAFMIDMTSRADLMNAISLNSSVVNGARIVGPAAAGFFMAHGGMALCFLFNGLSFLAVIAGLALMQLPPFVRPADPPSTWDHVRAGFVYVASQARLRRLLLLFAVVGIFGWSYSVLLPAYATDILRLDERQYGLLLGANGLGALVGALTVATAGNRLRPRRLVLGGLWSFTGMLLLLAWTRVFAVALVLIALAGGGMMLYFSTTNILLQTSTDDAMRGRVMGIWALVFGGMMPAGSLQAGGLAQQFGVPWTITIGAVICAGAAFVLWRQVRNAKSGHGCYPL